MLKQIIYLFFIATTINSGHISPDDKWYEHSIIPSLNINNFFDEVS